MPHCYSLSRISTSNLDTYPTSRFGKTMRHNLFALTSNHKLTGRTSYTLMITTWLESLPFRILDYEYLINIIFEDISYCITTSNIPHCTCPKFTKMSSQALGKKWTWCIVNIFIMCSHFCARWITRVTNSFTLRPRPTMRSCGYLNLLVL